MPLSSTPSASASTARFYWDDMEGHDDESNASTNDRQPLLMMRSTESPTSNTHPSVNPFDRISSTSVSSPLPGYSPPRASGQYSQDIAGWSSENSAPTISMSRQVHPSSRRYPDINVPQQRNPFHLDPTVTHQLVETLGSIGTTRTTITLTSVVAIPSKSY
ncbi:hypothetical protein BC829DRAFT_222598 [Chytridium lagenaria]|nr:hypothetical protein BC829DRAFT_222598 [Chytridium lagenaria]